MLAPVTQCLSSFTTIVHEQVLPVAGKVNAHVNQRVNPTDVIAEATFAQTCFCWMFRVRLAFLQMRLIN